MTIPEEGLSDNNIGAVINMACSEFINYNPQTFSLHISGLYQMISDRGGIEIISLIHEL